MTANSLTAVKKGKPMLARAALRLRQMSAGLPGHPRRFNAGAEPEALARFENEGGTSTEPGPRQPSMN
jgi:hypothetical protein